MAGPENPLCVCVCVCVIICVRMLITSSKGTFGDRKKMLGGWGLGCVCVCGGGVYLA